MKDSDISPSRLLEIIQEMKDVLIESEFLVEKLYRSEAFTEGKELDATSRIRLKMLRARAQKGRAIIDRIPY